MSPSQSKSQKKKLLVVSHSGVVSVNRIIYQRLASEYDIDIHLVVPKKWNGNLFANLNFSRVANDQALVISDVPVFFSGSGTFYFFCSWFWAMRRQWVPDIVFLDEEPWSLVAFQFNLLFSSYSKVIYTKETLPRPFFWPFSWIQKKVLEYSRGAFVISEDAKAVLKDFKHYQKPIFLLPHAFSEDLFYPRDSGIKESFRRKHGLDPDAFLVGFVGRFSIEKGVLDLLEVVSRFKALGETRIRFVFVGSGPLMSEIKKSAALCFPAIPHEQIADVMGCFDCLVVPSRTTQNWKEQFGRVIIESMACGVPVIGSNSGEIPVLIDQSKGGIVFSEGDVVELFQKIELMSRDSELTESLAKSGSDYVRQQFSYDAVTRTFAHNLSSLF